MEPPGVGNVAIYPRDKGDYYFDLGLRNVNRFQDE
jgi:hypothetical protein